MKWFKKNKFFLLVIILLICLSPFASSLPDGLEWAAGKIGFIDKAEENVVWTLSPFANYAIPGIENESLKTILSGVVGIGLTFVFVFCFTKFKKKRNETT